MRAKSSVFGRLRARVGREVDPQISLDVETEAGENPSDSSILPQIASHRPAGARYVLKGELARGGMGAILKVWDEELRRNLAMKVMLEGRSAHFIPESALEGERLLARFLE